MSALAVVLVVALFQLASLTDNVENADYSHEYNSESDIEYYQEWQDAENPQDYLSSTTLPIDQFENNETDANSSSQTILSELTTDSILKITDPSGNEEVSSRDADDCGDPPSVAHAVISRGGKSRYSAGDRVLYDCELGYSFENRRFGVQSEHTSTCEVSEVTQGLQWSKPDILCAPRSCGDPGFVEHARIEGSLFTFPNSITFVCEEGYAMKGYGVRYCQPSGLWSGTLPTCQTVVCDPPRNVDHGRVSFTLRTYGSELSYSCDEGYLLRNHSRRRVCSSNGLWSGEEPFCQEAQCEPPSAPDFGSVKIVGERSSVGSIALYTCNEGRILIGSSNSKCLDIGQWTFPTPKCAEQCSVPRIDHGTIKKIEARYYGRKVLTELEVGTAVEGEEQLLLICENKYEPFGKPSIEESISCRNGEWLQEPVCEPAQCRGPVPPTVNGKVQRANQFHGGTVTYNCKTPRYQKTAYGNVTCNFGTWKGTTPTCKDTSCHVDQLSFPGLVVNRKKLYQSGESFSPSCEPGFKQIVNGNIFKCNQGTWVGRMPPCSAANCTKEPPAIEHGFHQPYSTLHTSVVTYECDPSYTLLERDTNVQCNFGEWTGRPPTCRDETLSRCYLKDLKNLIGVSIDTEKSTMTGKYLRPVCLEGFSMNERPPLCEGGTWQEKSQACLENSCQVLYIPSGQLTFKVEKTVYVGLFRRAEKREELRRAPVGTMINPGETLYVSCIYRYGFQGKGQNHILVKCVRGKWTPSPLCLPVGALFREDLPPLRDDTHLIRSRTTAALPVVAASTRPAVTVRPREAHRDGEDQKRLEEGKRDKETSIATMEPENCFCTYENADPNVIAFSGKERLTFGSRVKQGCSVDFHCKRFGFMWLQGSPQITCKDCQPFHSSEFPECRMPLTGDAILELKGNWELLPGGVVDVQERGNISIRCISNGVDVHPEWIYTASDNAKVLKFTQLAGNGRSWIYISRLNISQADFRNEGVYQCAVPDYRSSLIDVRIRHSAEPKCSKFDENRNFLVHYSQEQNVNSNASFSCKNQDDKLIGFRVISCLPNGKWSDEPPQCITQCPLIEESDGLAVQYAEDRVVSSQATFHCFEPRIRNGVARTTCKLNGEWAHPAPSCEFPFCSLDSLFEVVPDGVVPQMEGVHHSGEMPYNATLNLTCEGDLRIAGDDVARCSNNGVWKVNEVQCVPGCPPIKKPDSELIVEPDRLFYRFGEFVTFSCPPGLELSNEVVRKMCLNSGWSDGDLPSCVGQ